MNENNITSINATDGQPVIVLDGKAYPIGYSTNKCTATAADIRKGKIAAVQSGIVAGTLEVSGGGGSFAKITRFVAPYDAYSAVSSVQVSGFGEAEEPWSGETLDFSDWNDTYQVTPGTAQETDINKKIFKHPTDNKYLYRIWCVDNWGYYWVLDSDTNANSIYNAYFIGGEELTSGRWNCVDYDWQISVDLSFKQNTTNYPAQPLELEAVSANYANGDWSFGSAVSLTGYAAEPITNGIYLVDGNRIIGDAVDYAYEKWMPTNGLLSYFPMTGPAIAAVDVISKTKLYPKGKGVSSGVGRWYGNGSAGVLGGSLPYPCPKVFTLALKFNMSDCKGGDYLPLFQVDGGLGLFIRGDYNSVRARMGNAYAGADIENIERDVDCTAFLICDGSNLRTYCVQNGETVDDRETEEFERYDDFVFPIYVLGYAWDETMTGEVWDILLYDRILTEQEIATIANHN